MLTFLIGFSLSVVTVGNKWKAIISFTLHVNCVWGMKNHLEPVTKNLFFSI